MVRYSLAPAGARVLTEIFDPEGAVRGGFAGYATRDGDNITLNMPGNVTFDTDSAALRPQFFGVLNSVGKVLTEYEKTVIEVAGHTDSTGSDSYNMQLSQRRANTVGEYLYTQGIMDQRIISVGMGEHHPIADNSTPEGRQMNRRVEITLVPVTAG